MYFCRLQNKRIILYCISGLKVLHQLSGGIAIQSYMKSIFQLADTSLDPDTASIICSIVPLPASMYSEHYILYANIHHIIIATVY